LWVKLTSETFADLGTIPPRCAFAEPDLANHVRLSANRNPQLAWSGIPAGTHSLALLCHDPDVPSRADDVNLEGHTIAASLPRVDFFHWVLIDLAPDAAPIARGEFSDGVTARGKPGPRAPRGARQGINDYTGWFAGDKDMGGDYFGYDGPCPPWNDAIPHHYVFTIFALDVARLSVAGTFTGAQARAAMAGHILGQAAVTGRYTLNPAVKL
jgi:Raf kinase inhibitor-like YbhB/YbcL family protein